MRIAICDDDLREQEQLEQALREWDPSRGAERFFDGAALLEAAGRQPGFDIAFLDVYMPGENGVDVARALREISPETGIAFVTTSREHAVEAFSLHALHYLVKPVTAQGVEEAFRRLAELRSQRRRRITFTVGPERHTVFEDQICLLEADDHAVIVSLSDGRRLRVWGRFGALAQQLGAGFLKINRGLIVNMDFVARMEPDTCTLRDGIRLPIAVRHSAAIRAAYDDYVFDQLSRQGKPEARP